MSVDSQNTQLPDGVENEDIITVVERHPGNKSSVWLIIIFVLIVTVFGYLSDDKHEIKVQIDSSSGQNNSPDNEKQNIFSTSNIHQLIARTDVAALKKYLLTTEDEAINEVVDGMTPIMVAASLGNVEIIDMLFTQGADPNKRGSMERTALQYATEKNHIEAAKRLLAYGADIDARDNGYITPLRVMIISGVQAD
jgi:ankyrin repeat protein